MKAWEEFESKIAALPQFEPNVIKLRRVYVSAAVECEVDKQGRVLVPNSLRDHAMLKKDVLWAGMGQMVELWAREKWDDVQSMTANERAEFRRAVAEQLIVELPQCKLRTLLLPIILAQLENLHLPQRVIEVLGIVRPAYGFLFRRLRFVVAVVLKKLRPFVHAHPLGVHLDRDAKPAKTEERFVRLG